MGYLLEIAATGLASVRLYPVRSLVSITALVVVLLPYLVGLGLSEGIRTEAEASVSFGADLYVSGSQFGRPVPLPLAAVSNVRAIEGVTEVLPRIVGVVSLGKEEVRAVLVGMPAEHFLPWGSCISGELPQRDNELVIGTALAHRLNLKVGSVLPPFYHNEHGERLSRVVGVFQANAPLWQANLVLTTFDTATLVFDQPGLATDLLVWCRPGYQESISRRIVRDLALSNTEGRGTVRPRVVAREDLQALLPQGLLHREGIFTLHFVLAFAVGILVLLVTSGFGLSERRREIGILKATGWQTDEVLLRGAAESLSLSLAGGCLSLLLAWVWLAWFNGRGIAGIFLAGVSAVPEFPVPYRLAPVPALLCFALSFVIVCTGTLWSSWRAATAAPREAMR
jgi:ABC-type lipoprotein release transport system permease subunit